VSNISEQKYELMYVFPKPNKNDEPFQVELKYEHIPNFCYYCGMLTHVAKVCPTLPKNLQDPPVFPFGPWIRGVEFVQRKTPGARFGIYEDTWNYWDTEMITKTRPDGTSSTRKMLTRTSFDMRGSSTGKSSHRSNKNSVFQLLQP
jgi:hypothetical protein